MPSYRCGKSLLKQGLYHWSFMKGIRHWFPLKKDRFCVCLLCRKPEKLTNKQPSYRWFQTPCPPCKCRYNIDIARTVYDVLLIEGIFLHCTTTNSTRWKGVTQFCKHGIHKQLLALQTSSSDTYNHQISFLKELKMRLTLHFDGLVQYYSISIANHLGGPDSALLQQDLRVPWVKASRLYQAS